MPLAPEQVKILKEQLLSQIQNLPEDKKEEAAKQIEELSPQALELMLKQQRVKGKSEESIFRFIVSGEIPSKIIDENASAIAVLEINPISNGHTIIIPRKPVQTAKEMPTQAFTLAKKLSKRIISKLKAKSTEIQTEIKMNEMIINIIPIYEQSLNIESPRKKAQNEELDTLEKLLKVKKKIKIEKIKKEANETRTGQRNQILKLSRKIP